jgi:hypothetical protein
VFGVLFFVQSFFVHGLLLSQESVLPLLVGDGVVDDAAAIQARLDSGAKHVYLPEPKRCYLIKKALVIHSDQTLRLDPQTTIRLADGACDYLLTNDGKETEEGNKNIRIIGGIWDGNNLNQTCDYRKGDRGQGGLKKYMGNAIFLMNVENLWLEGLTIKDPETFGAHLAKVRKFTVKDIVFDYNCELWNEDGIHVKGPSSEGFIQNLKGNTNDDMVALNADDQPMFEPSFGEISDVRIDGLYASNGFTAVRFLSGGSPIKRVHISNIFGSFRINVISFTHFGIEKSELKLIEDVTIDNVHVARQINPNMLPQPNWQMKEKGTEKEEDRYTAEELARKPFMWWEEQRKKREFFFIQRGMTVDNIKFSNITRREFLAGTRELITIGKGAVVRNLSLRDVLQENKTDVNLPLIRNEGTVERIIFDNVQTRGNVSNAIINRGKILEIKGEIDQK